MRENETKEVPAPKASNRPVMQVPRYQTLTALLGIDDVDQEDDDEEIDDTDPEYAALLEAELDPASWGLDSE